MTVPAAPGVEADLRLALRAVRAAGDAVMGWFRARPEVRLKGPDQPVTAADLRADALLREHLVGARPDYGWLSEETADHPDRLGRPRVWIVDPIDGTRSFVAGYREFAISVGLVDRGAALLGVVYNPALQDLVWATREGGAFRVRPWDGGDDPARGRRAPVRLRVRPPPRRGRPSVLASRSEIRSGEFDAMSTEWTVRPLGSTAYKLTGVAAGIAHAYLSRGPKSEWDVVAGALVVAEAGGRVTDLRGELPVYNRADPSLRGMLACAPALYPALARAARDGAPRSDERSERRPEPGG